jgi:hypothetical protein
MNDMCRIFKNTFFFQELGSVPLLPGCILVCLSIAFILSATSIRAQEATEAPSGLAWHVRGTWQVNDTSAPILDGDAIKPGALLEPSEATGSHSIVIYLPDGQRILYECFTAQDCARGFRVPSLYRRPEPLAVEVVARIRAALAKKYDDASTGSSVHRTSLPRDEVMAVLNSGHEVEVGGLASKLPNGHYISDLRPLDPSYPRQSHLVIEKRASSITVPLPSAGLYTLKISDDLNVPRIDLFIAAVTPVQAPGFIKSFTDAKALLKQWYGWPIHDFQRAYLESLFSGATPVDAASSSAPNSGAPGGNVAGRGTGRNAKQVSSTDVTAEPTFVPRPGLLDGFTSLTLQCDTPGAVVHYTIDSSQPRATSPVYAAPIVLKGEGIAIIKAFASAAGKKDSAVVTGIFRIRQP